MAISKPVTIGGGVVGSIGALGGGVYGATKENIQYQIKDNFLPEDASNEDWKELAKKKISSETESSEIKTALTGITDESQKGQHLKEWCSKQYSSTFKSAFSSENLDLLNLVKKWCIFSIKDKLEENKVLDTEGASHDEGFEINFNLLKEQSVTSSSELLKELKVVKENSSKTKEDLKEWCKKAKERGYQGDNELWKLSSKFCTKPTIGDKVSKSVLPQDEEFNSEWEKKGSKAASDTNGMQSTITGSNDAEKGANLKKWCSDNYDTLYDANKTGSTTEKLLALVEKWCIYTIKEKISENSKEPIDADATGKDTDWQTLFESLKTYSPDSKTNKPTLTTELTKIKEENKETNKKADGGTALQKWCKETYTISYTKSTKDLATLASTFCIKSN